MKRRLPTGADLGICAGFVSARPLAQAAGSTSVAVALLAAGPF